MRYFRFITPYLAVGVLSFAAVPLLSTERLNPSDAARAESGASKGRMTQTGTTSELITLEKVEDSESAQGKPANEGLLGQPFDDFLVEDLRGDPLSTSQFRGKVVLVTFWASWCPPCRREIPVLVKLYEKNRERGFEIIGINLDSARSFTKVPALVKAEGIGWPQHSDKKGVLADRYGVQWIPETILIDRDGKVRGRGQHGTELESAVDTLLGMVTDGRTPSSQAR